MAQEASATQVKQSQYLLLVDDSCSMDKDGKGGAGTDPDRLAVFAVRALLEVLEDSDEVSVGRLNAPKDGETFPPMRPLAEARGSLAGALAPDGRLARYNGRTTDCAAGLAAGARVLNDAWRPGVPQALIFLTDGACEGAVDGKGFLSQLKSHKDGEFHFYLLRFVGKEYSQALEALARETDGATYAIPAGEPTGIVLPFAQAIARTHGYEPILLSPANRRLTSHRASRRVRVLSVAPGDGEPLRLSAEPAGPGTGPDVSKSQRTGAFRYGAGRPFRYAVVDYGPGDTAVNINTVGASDWKAVALPHYRATVVTRVTSGACASDGEAVQSTEVGGMVCVRASLVNDTGRVVYAEDFGSSQEFVLELQDPVTGRTELPMNRTGGLLAATIERGNLAEGDFVFRPSLKLALATGPVTLRGRPATVQASSLKMQVTPSRLDFGAVVPGDVKTLEVEIAGNVPPGPGQLTVASPEALPACVAFLLDGRPSDGPAEQVMLGRHTITMQVSPFCSFSAIQQQFESALRLKVGGASVGIPVQLKLDSQFEAPRELAVQLKGGEAVSAPLEVKTNARKPPVLELHVVDPEGGGGGDVELLLVGQDGAVLREADGTPRRHGRYEPGAAGEVASVRVAGSPCCAAGTHLRKLALVSDLPDAQGKRLNLRLDVKADVTGAGLAACYGARIAAWTAVFLALLFLVFCYRAWTNSHFLDPRKLASKFTPLERQGSRHEPAGRAASVRRTLETTFRAVLSPPRRLSTWLSAGGWRAGLGRPYLEVVALYFETRRETIQPGPSPSVARRTPATLRPNTIYAEAAPGGRVSLWARLKKDEDGVVRINRFEARETDSGDGEEVATPTGWKLVNPEADGDGAFSGWEVG